MTDLIACLSLGKGTWTEVLNLANSGNFENIYLITNTLVKEKINKAKFKNPEKIKFIVIDEKMDVENISDEIHKNLEGRIKDLEVALNLNSGIGKEHMAIISAVLRLGIGIRQVVWKQGSMRTIA